MVCDVVAPLSISIAMKEAERMKGTRKLNAQDTKKLLLGNITPFITYNEHVT